MSDWYVKPLDGKYYCTFVENKTTGERIDIPSYLFDDNYIASVREIANGWEPDHGFDHVETQRAYELACTIVKALQEQDDGI